MNWVFKSLRAPELAISAGVCQHLAVMVLAWLTSLGFPRSSPDWGIECRILCHLVNVTPQGGINLDCRLEMGSRGFMTRFRANKH